MRRTYQKIHKIELPVPFPTKTINVYLVDKEPITLIDAGVKTDTSFRVLKGSLRTLGYEIKDIRRIVITHGHRDHYGQAKKISALSGAEIYIHEEEYQAIQSFAQFWSQVASVLVQNGVPKDSVKKTLHKIESTQQWAEPLDDVHFIHEGEEIYFKDIVLRTLHCPGHSPGSLCFYYEEKGILVSGDHVLREITPNPVINPLQKSTWPQYPSLKQYLNSIRKIKDLEVFLVLPGHGGAFRDFKATLEKILHHHEQRLATVLSILSLGEKTAYDISGTLFPNTKSYEIFLGMFEILGHLSILLEEGKVSIRSRNGIDYFSTHYFKP